MIRGIGILILLLLFGCNQPPENIKTNHNEYSVIIRLYDNVDDVKKACGGERNGCFMYYKSSPNKGAIHTIRSRCVLDHEIDHLLYGEFHKDGASCTTRAN